MSEKQLYESGMLEIVKGALITFLMGLFGYTFMFFFKLIGARYLGPEDWGLYTLSWTILSALLILPSLGLFDGITIYLQEYIAKKQQYFFKGFLQFSLLISSVIALIISVLLFTFSREITLFFNYPENFSSLLKIVSFLLIVKVLTNFLRQVLWSNKEFFKANLSKQFFESGGLFFAGFFTFIFNLNLIMMYKFILVFSFVSLFLEFLLAKKILDKYLFVKLRPSFDIINWFSFSFPLLFIGMFTFLLGWTDNLMLGKLMVPSSLAVYSIAFSLASFTLFFQLAFIKVFSPLAAQKFFNKEKKDLVFLFKKSASWVFGLTFPVFLVFTLYSKQILNLIYGKEYVLGYWPLIILSLGMVFNVSFGFSSTLIIIHKKTKFIFKLTLLLAIINLILNYFFILRWGIVGAAISTALIMVFRELVFFLKARTLESISLDWVYYLKFVLAGLLAIYPAAQLFKFHTNIYFTLIISGIIYSVLYLVFLLFFRTFKSEDYELFLLIEKKTGLNLVFIKKIIKKIIG